MVQYATLPAASADTLRVIIRSMLTGRDDYADDFKGTIKTRLGALFNEVLKSGDNKSTFKTAAIIWVDKPIERAEPKDIVIYLVKNLASGVIKRVDPATYHKLARESQDERTGATIGGTGPSLSEVYSEAAYNDQPELVANTMFNESLHNKLNEGDEMHGEAKFVGGGGGFLQADLPRRKDLELQKEDKQLLGLALSKDRPQRVGL